MSFFSRISVPPATIKGNKDTKESRPAAALTAPGCPASLSVCGSLFRLPETEPALATSLTCPASFQRIPHAAVEVIIAGQQKAAALGESHGRDPADDVIVRIQQ